MNRMGAQAVAPIFSCREADFPYCTQMGDGYIPSSARVCCRTVKSNPFRKVRTFPPFRKSSGKHTSSPMTCVLSVRSWRVSAEYDRAGQPSSATGAAGIFNPVVWLLPVKCGGAGWGCGKIDKRRATFCIRCKQFTYTQFPDCAKMIYKTKK